MLSDRRIYAREFRLIWGVFPRGQSCNRNGMIWRMPYRRGPRVLLEVLQETSLKGCDTPAASRLSLGVLMITVIVNATGFFSESILPVIGRDTLGLSAVRRRIGGRRRRCSGRRRWHDGWPSRYGKFFILRFFGLPSFSVFCFALSPYFSTSLITLLIGGFGVAGFSSMPQAILLSVAPPGGSAAE